MKKIKKNNETTTKPDIFEHPKIHFFMIAVIIVVISTLFFPVGFQKYAPRAHDTQQWRWASEELIEYNKTAKDKALWTDNMFSGMPSYLLSFPPKFPFFHQIPHYLNFLINWRVLSLIFGAIGMYILLIYLKFSPLIALFSALAFALSPHFIGLIEIGHNTKFRTIMYLPWIYLSFEDLRLNKRLFSLGLLSIVLIDQLRINHFQISYYTFLMLFTYWFVFLCKSIKEKNLLDYTKFTLLFISAIVITVLAVANPYLSTREYTQFTIRGGAGLSADYATSWSFGINETISLFVPKFYGGISPLYWGPMPFTQTFHYMGIVTIYLAIIASIFLIKNTRILAFVIICIISLLISYGRHLPVLSHLLLSYLPLFNKFRVPAMILCILQFIVPILAAYGLKHFIERIKVKDKVFTTTVLVSLLLSLGFFYIFYNGQDYFSNLTFTNPERVEAMRLSVAQFEHLKNERLGALIDSGIRSFAMLSIAIVLLFILLKGFFKKNVVIILLIALSVYDLTHINSNHLKIEDMVKESSILNDFPTRDTDLYLINDNDLFRIYPFHDFHTTRWSYYHQTIGGYHGAKLSRYQDILDFNLNAEIVAGVPINWNVINMLNVKYLIFNSHVNLLNNDIEFVHLDVDTRHAIYRNNAVLPRAWFVKNHEIYPERSRMSLRINDPSFNPEDTALVEEAVPRFYYAEDSTIELIDRNKHYTKWTTSNSEDSFMVISEVYYPAGWNVYVNNVKTAIYPVNHILRGVIVTSGENIVEMKFEPSSYRISVILSMIGLSLSILLTVLGIMIYYNKNFGKGVVYKLNS